MNAMTILRRCRAAKGDLERLEQRLEQRREVLGSLSAPQADPNGGSRGAGDRDKIGLILADIDELEREAAARREAAEAEKVASCVILDMVPALEGKVLYDYYVRRWDTGQIARKEKYTAGYVRKTKRNAEQLAMMISPERIAGTLPPWYLREKGGDDK